MSNYDDIINPYKPNLLPSEAQAFQQQIRQRDLKIEQLLNQIHNLQSQLSDKQKTVDAHSSLISKYEIEIKEKDEKVR